ncbi:protein-glutamate methylesterase/protein-glutamine glutaminase [Shewanella psychrotolerans]|uniref:protein-glutamate methylesterase/protein-glutamine glutaminase n=1 Tax=Shewanella psychrotolerans TaxID=2864206 RepID=UPI001C657441|nr:chemotaxis response regulator protein-glutamate methylesterase [Shewanella psychrotolerans]QYK01514.1 chemotaxis response regulator protein-glutamate methylesterase [Shewanella psychrotolerans]
MIKVLVIDDSPLVRQLLSHMLNDAPDINVIATAEDPYEARTLIKQHNPDVLTLDIEMPKMDGIAFLRNLMKLRPMPVIMVSTLTHKGAEVTLEALALGAIDFISKPKADLTNTLLEYKDELIAKIRVANKSHVKATTKAPQIKPAQAHLSLKTDKVIAIGASTGGTEAIQRVITQLPANTPPIVIAQHIPAAFSLSFAKRLNSHAAINVIEAQGGETLEVGTAYLAPGNAHLIVEQRGGKLYTKLLETDPVNRHKPSVDVLFNSVAECIGQRAIGILLTGMGKDGAAGLLNLKKMGGYNLIQDQASSVVWGMPGAAAELNAQHENLHLDKISGRLIQLLNTAKSSVKA